MHRPFEALEELLKKSSAGALGERPTEKTGGQRPPLQSRAASNEAAGEQRDFPVDPLPDSLSDAQLFDYAMKDVRRLGWSATPLHRRPPMELQPQDDEKDALRALEEFIRNGNVEIEHTAEYIEGFVHPKGRLFIDDLRSGKFAIQAYLDLHGMNQQAARFALDEFILASTRAGFWCVRVIHGRGRHSHQNQPVLKESIQRWLCSRRMSRHVLAYTSARQFDGGGGAIYILLRR